MPTHAVDTIPLPWNDETRPSLFSLLASNNRLRAAIESLPEERLLQHERSLEREIRKDHEGKFPRTLGFLKINFWDEYNNALREKRVMEMDNVFYGICHRLWFYKHVVDTPCNLAWLICPPTDEILVQRDLLNKARIKMGEALEADIFEYKYESYISKATGKKCTRKTRKVNVPLLKEIHAIAKTLEDRIHGGIIQRQQIIQKNLNVNVPLPPQASSGALSLDSPDLTLDQLEAFSKKIGDVRTQLEAHVGGKVVVIEDEETHDPPANDP